MSVNNFLNRLAIHSINSQVPIAINIERIIDLHYFFSVTAAVFLSSADGNVGLPRRACLDENAAHQHTSVTDLITPVLAPNITCAGNGKSGILSLTSSYPLNICTLTKVLTAIWVGNHTYLPIRCMQKWVITQNGHGWVREHTNKGHCRVGWRRTCST